jgi:hypothetical protein
MGYKAQAEFYYSYRTLTALLGKSPKTMIANVSNITWRSFEDVSSGSTTLTKTL